MTKSARLTEKELLLLLKQKDENAFSYIYDQYAPSIYGIILREVKNAKLAAEILKKTFLNIVNECNTIDCIKQSTFAWLLILMKKTANADFRVDINLKSLFSPPKCSIEKIVDNDVSHQTRLNLFATSQPL